MRIWYRNVDRFETNKPVPILIPKPKISFTNYRFFGRFVVVDDGLRLEIPGIDFVGSDNFFGGIDPVPGMRSASHDQAEKQ